ncbi:MAG TPA: sulfotransferase domain-containing protein [Gammaproteobacteria bacterium]|nr:sulfotransferase domain-containing protein [Gammaproteobacteria bacterium]
MYQHISGPDQTNIGIDYAKISVVPKSGYLGMCVFFNTYEQLLSQPNNQVEITHAHAATSRFGKKHFQIGHIECPQFREHANPQELALWDALAYTRSIPWSMYRERAPYAEFSSQSRLVFIYRNPLDQLVSHYKHCNKLPADDAADPIDPQALEKFIFEYNALGAYIKMFYSFHIARQHYAAHILFVPYEEIMQNRAYAMQIILRHLALPYDETAFNRALESTSITRLKAEEQLRQSAISGGSGPSRHIRNGGTGVWQKHMTPQMVQRIEAELQKFDLSLCMFHLADEFEPQFAFLQPMSSSNIRARARL